jgi:hypothetical protein
MTDTLTALKKNAEHRDALIIERDTLIFQAKSEGAPVTHIADAIGLDRTQIHRILRDSWLVAEVATGKIRGWHRSEEAAKAEASLDANRYYRQVQVEANGSWC